LGWDESDRHRHNALDLIQGTAKRFPDALHPSSNPGGSMKLLKPVFTLIAAFVLTACSSTTSTPVVQPTPVSQSGAPVQASGITGSGITSAKMNRALL
jgi:hypothetical protein